MAEPEGFIPMMVRHDAFMELGFDQLNTTEEPEERVIAFERPCDKCFRFSDLLFQQDDDYLCKRCFDGE